MKLYTVMYSLDVKEGNYNKDLWIDKDPMTGELYISPEVFASKEKAEQWINMNPEDIRKDYTIVEVGLRSN